MRVISQGMAYITNVILQYDVSLKRGILTKLFFVRKWPFTSTTGNIFSEPLISKEDLIVREKRKGNWDMI